MNYRLPLSLLIVLCSFVPAWAEEATIIRNSVVYDRPSSTSDSVGQIEAGARVSVFERKGGWKLIFSDQAALTGWVRSFQVRSGDFTEAAKVTSETDSRGFLSGLASFSRKASGFFGGNRSTTSNRTSTIGVRGLSEAEIKSALPDFEELEKMQGFASNSQRLSVFSSTGQLKPRPVTHLKPVDSRDRKNEK